MEHTQENTPERHPEENEIREEQPKKVSSPLHRGLINTLEVISISTAIVGIVVKNFSESGIFPILVWAGFVVLAISYLFRSRLQLESKRNESTVQFMNKMVNYSLAVMAVGLLFAIQKLPGAYIILLVAGATCIVSLLIALLLFQNKEPFGMKENIRLLLYTLIGVILLSLEYF